MGAKKSKNKAEGPAAKAGSAGPRDVVAGFLKHTIDEPDMEKAKGFLDSKTLAAATFHGEGPPKGTVYSIGEEQKDPLGMLIPVKLTGKGPDGATQEMTMPFVLVQEKGAWKIDLNASTERMFNPMMDALKDAAQQMGEVMGKAMEGIGEAISQGLGGGSGGSGGDGGGGKAPEIEAERLEKFMGGPLEDFRTGLQQAFDSQVVTDVDVPRFLTGADAHENSQILDLFEQDLFRPFDYNIRQVNEKMPLGERLSVIRFEPVASAGERAIFLDGSRLIYRLMLGRSSEGGEGTYSVSDLEQILPPLLAGLPERIDPREAAGPGPASWTTKDAMELRMGSMELVSKLTDRICASVQHGVSYDADWTALPDSNPGQYIWGLQRVVGAMAYLTADEEKLAVLKEEMKGVSVRAIEDPAQKQIRWSEGRLGLDIAPAHGEAGAFYEWEIAAKLGSALKLAERPAMKDLYNEAATWEERLKELFTKRDRDGEVVEGHAISYHIDWDGFTSHPDTSTNLRGLHILKEHGIDHIYYAISGLAEKNPNFRQQFGQRVTMLRLVHVAEAKQKGMSVEGSEIIYRLAIHTGYDGYLTLDQMQKLLPKLVAEMPDLPAEFSGKKGGTAMSSDEEEEVRELQEMAREEARRVGKEESDDDEDSEEEESGEQDSGTLDIFNQARVEMQNTLPMYQSQMEAIVGKPIDVAIDWESLKGEVEMISNLLNAALSPIIGGLAYLAQDMAIRTKMHDMVDHILLARTEDPARHGFSLDDTTLVFQAYLGKGRANISPMDPQVASVVIRNLLASDGPKKAAKPSKIAAKPPAKAPAKSAAKKPSPPSKASKSPAKPAKKPKRR